MGAGWPLFTLDDGALEDGREDEVLGCGLWICGREAGDGMQEVQKVALQLFSEQTQSSVLLLKGDSQDTQVLPVQWEKCRSFVQEWQEGGFGNKEGD